MVESCTGHATSLSILPDQRFCILVTARITHADFLQIALNLVSSHKVSSVAVHY